MVIQAIVLQKKEKGKRERKRKKKLLISQWCFQIREDKKNGNSGNGFAENRREEREKIYCNCGNSVAKIEKIKKKKKEVILAIVLQK